VWLHELVAASAAVAEASSRLVKVDRLAMLLRHVTPQEVEVAIAFLSVSRDRDASASVLPPSARPDRLLALTLLHSNFSRSTRSSTASLQRRAAGHRSIASGCCASS